MQRLSPAPLLEPGATAASVSPDAHFALGEGAGSPGLALHKCACTLHVCVHLVHSPCPGLAHRIAGARLGRECCPWKGSCPAREEGALVPALAFPPCPSLLTLVAQTGPQPLQRRDEETHRNSTAVWSGLHRAPHTRGSLFKGLVSPCIISGPPLLVRVPRATMSVSPQPLGTPGSGSRALLGEHPASQTLISSGGVCSGVNFGQIKTL